MKEYVILIIIVLSTNVVAGFNSQDIEWGTNISGTLYKGNTLTNGEYTINVTDFTSPVQGVQIIENNQKKIVPETKVEPAVHLEIYKNNIFVKDIVLTLISSSYTDPDYEVKISATDFLPGNSKEWVMEYYKPWARITIQKRGVPRFDVTFKFTPEKKDNIFINGDTFTVNIAMKNSGEAVAKNVDVNLDIGPLRLLSDKSKLHQTYYEIRKGDSKNFDIMFTVPEMLGEQELNITLDDKFYDVKDIEYKNTSYSKITTSPRLINIGKSMKDRIYLKDISTVRIIVTNTGTFDAYNIHINDSLNGNFELKSDSLLEWDIPLLKPGQDWGITYSVKALEANIDGFTIPTANVSFLVNNKMYNISSLENKVIVNGPKIILNKTVDKKIVNMGEFITVNVTIKNAGNIGTRIEVKDTLPDNVSLREGILSLANWSEPGSVQGFGYTIIVSKEGKIELPSVVSNYTDVEYKGTVRAVISSDRPTITVIDPKKVTPLPTPENTSTPEATIVIPGFEGILTVIGMLLVTLIIHEHRR